MKIAVYSRKSKLSDKGESVQNQVQMCKDYSEANFGKAEFIVYEDEGFSGGTTDRPAFNRMLGDAREARFDKLVCYRLDRISRSVVDFSSTLDLLSRHDIAFVSITEHFDTGTPIGRAMMFIASVFAQLERETIAERIRDNMLKLAHTGRWLGGPAPLGYTLYAEKYTADNAVVKKRTALAVEPSEAEQVKYIYNSFLEVGAVTALVKSLKKADIRTKKGAYYCQRTLIQTLRNPVYVQSDARVYEYFKRLGSNIACEADDFNGNGLMLCNKHVHTGAKHRIREATEWIISAGSHPGIIEADKWLEVQSVMDTNRQLFTRGRAGTSEVGLLGGLITCGSCGTKMRIAYRAKEKDDTVKHYYYRCRLKDADARQCNIKNINGRMADAAVIQGLVNLAGQGNAQLLKSLTAAKNDIPSASRKLIKQRESYERQIDELSIKIETLTDRLAQPDVDTVVQGYILKQIKKYDSDIEGLKRQLGEMKGAEDDMQCKTAAKELLTRGLLGFRGNLDFINFATKKSYIKELVSVITWDGEMLDIKLRACSHYRNG